MLGDSNKYFGRVDHLSQLPIVNLAGPEQGDRLQLPDLVDAHHSAKTSVQRNSISVLMRQLKCSEQDDSIQAQS